MDTKLQISQRKSVFYFKTSFEEMPGKLGPKVDEIHIEK